MSTVLGFSSIWLWLALAIVLVVALVLIVLSALVRQSAKAGGTSLANLLDEDAEEGDLAAEPDAGPEKVPGLSASFRRAIGFLRSTIGGRDFRYHIPWYLIAGDPNSGKKSLMSGVGANLADQARFRDPRSLLNWHFLDGGVLLGLAGRAWKSGSGRGDWTATLRLLRNTRPRRPVDGVVLTVSATDLVGAEALDDSALTAAAARYAEMFTQAQRSFGFTFPVYLVVTKCDEIEGFREFCRELPAKNRENIFGWSSPYHLDAAFSPEWVEEGFESVARDLQRLQSEIFVEHSDLHDAERLFLFPENFAHLRMPLYVYLDRLFRETSYREAFRFRGIYFCGDPSEPAAPLAPGFRPADVELEFTAQEEIAPPDPLALGAMKKRSPAFVKDLFEKKIFQEVGVARPLSRVFLVKSRASRMIQLGAAALGLILITGTALAYHRMSVDRDLLRPPLVEMYNQRVDSNGLLQELYAADRVSFSSPFVPASYFSRIDTDVTDVMRRATETWVMGSLQRRLMDKKRTVLAPPPEEPETAPKTDAFGDTAISGQPLVATLIATPEFQELRDFHEKLKSFQDYVNVYDQIRKTGKPGDMQRIQQLLDYLGLNQVQPHGHLLTALSTSSGPPVLVSPEESRYVVDRLNESIDGMFEDWSANNTLVAHMDRLRQSVSSLEQGSTTRMVERLRAARENLHVVEVDLATPDFRWASSGVLMLDEPVKRLLNNPLDLGNTGILLAAQNNGQRYLDGLRLRLLDERTAMTDRLLVAEPFGLAPRVGDLRLALENVLNLRFMTEIPVVRPIQVRLPETRRLLWRLEPIQEALRLHEVYTEFVRDGSRGAFDSMRIPLSRVAQEQMKRHVEDLIAESQEIQNRPPPGAGVGLEDETLPEVNSFRAAVGPLQQIAEMFQTDGVEIRNSVLRILVVQSYNLLAALDRRLGAENSYAIKEGNWTGKSPLSLAFFDVRNPGALTELLATQRDHIGFLEKQAEPLVPFLNQYLPVRPESQNRLILKWQRIIDDFHQYEARRPNAALTALEDFVVNEMDKIPENACAAGGQPVDDSPDYFIQTRNALRAVALERCRDINAVNVCRTYGTISNLFNSTMAGKFPFAAIAAGKTQAEVNPEALRAFYDEFDRSGKVTRTLLERDSRFGDAAQRGIQFLNRMEELRPIVIAVGVETAKEPPLTLNFVPLFRTNQNAEIGGNQIVEWDLQMGGQIIQQHQEHEGIWRPGNPVRLSLRWANDSALVPVAGNQPDLRIIQRNAFFEYSNRWALLSFLRRHEAPSAETDTQTYTLRFNVNTKRDEKWPGGDNTPASGAASVYMQMRLFAPGSKTPVRLPAFPVSAPILGCQKE